MVSFKEFEIMMSFKEFEILVSFKILISIVVLFNDF